MARAITSISTLEGAPLKLRLGGGFLPVDAPAPSEDYPFPLPTRAVRWNSIPIELTSFIKDGALRFGDRELSGDWLLRP